MANKLNKSFKTINREIRIKIHLFIGLAHDFKTFCF